MYDRYFENYEGSSDELILIYIDIYLSIFSPSYSFIYPQPKLKYTLIELKFYWRQRDRSVCSMG